MQTLLTCPPLCVNVLDAVRCLKKKEKKGFVLVFDQRQHVSYSAVFSDGFSRGVPFCRCLNSVDYSLKLSALSRKLIKKKKKKNM